MGLILGTAGSAAAIAIIQAALGLAHRPPLPAISVGVLGAMAAVAAQATASLWLLVAGSLALGARERSADAGTLRAPRALTWHRRVRCR